MSEGSEPQERTTVEEAGAMGGRARAAKLSPEERSDIARRAVEARWEKEGKLKPVPQATHGSPDRPLRIGEIEIPCYVLPDKTRVVVQAGMIEALGMSKGGSSHKGGTRLAKFASGERIKPFAASHLLEGTQEPIKFRTPGGTLAFGFEATILAELCEAVLAARAAGVLQKQQEHVAARAEILLRGFARVGIIGLVDEATGYQADREWNALQAILDRYLRREFAAWAKRFPDEFYKQMFRLRGWNWKGMKVNRPQCVAAYTKDLIYLRLAPGILEELETRNPVLVNGRRESKHHQWLTDEIGHPALAQHLHAVIGLMRASPDKDWSFFKRLLDRAFPQRGHSIQLDIFDFGVPISPEQPDEQSPDAASS
jgi:hypothetical protein